MPSFKYAKITPSLSFVFFPSHVEANPGHMCSLCVCGQYFVFTGVLAMVTCAVFLRLNSLLKLAVLLLMVAVYSLLTEAFYAALFVRYDIAHRNAE